MAQPAFPLLLALLRARDAPLAVLVPTGRLELPRLTPLPPQDSVSTNSTTSALVTGAISVRRPASTRPPSPAPQAQLPAPQAQCPAARRPVCFLWCPWRPAA